MIRLSRTEERVPLRGTRRASYGAARRTLPPIVLSSTMRMVMGFELPTMPVILKGPELEAKARIATQQPFFSNSVRAPEERR